MHLAGERLNLGLIGLGQVMGAVDVKLTSDQELTLEWDSSASNDMIADSTLALITGIDCSPASAKRTLCSPNVFLHKGA